MNEIIFRLNSIKNNWVKPQKTKWISIICFAWLQYFLWTSQSISGYNNEYNFYIISENLYFYRHFIQRCAQHLAVGKERDSNVEFSSDVGYEIQNWSMK